MRILQLIDSLDPGGAEKMAVNYANLLSREIEKSYLCATRQEGLLINEIDDKVNYLFLNRKSTFDIVAFYKLRRYILKEKITIIHAHSTSFFLATLLKLSLSQLKLVWHDHYGNSEHLESRKFGTLRYCSRYFNGIIAVNELLREWAIKKLKTEKVCFLSNFYVPSKVQNQDIKFKGQAGSRIVCLANLRHQKDHITLLKAFKKVMKTHPQATLHLLGAYQNDLYYQEIQDYILEEDLTTKVHLYGSANGVMSLLQQGDIGVLSSKSEGLPLALIEYGIASLPVVCTDVGECKTVLNGLGKLVPSGDSIALAKSLSTLLESNREANALGQKFHDHVLKHYTHKAHIARLLQLYNSLSVTHD